VEHVVDVVAVADRKAGFVRLPVRAVSGEEAPEAMRLHRQGKRTLSFRAFGGHLYEPVPERTHRREQVLARLLFDDLNQPRAVVRDYQDKLGFMERPSGSGPVPRAFVSPAELRMTRDLGKTWVGEEFRKRLDMLLAVDGTVYLRSMGPVLALARNAALPADPVFTRSGWMASAEALSSRIHRTGIFRHDRAAEAADLPGIDLAGAAEGEVEVLSAMVDAELPDDADVVLDAMAALAFETFGRLRLSSMPREAVTALRTCAASVAASWGNEPQDLHNGPLSENPSVFSVYRPFRTEGVREAVADLLDVFSGRAMNKGCQAAFGVLDTLSRRPSLGIDRSPGRNEPDDALALGGAFGP